MPRTWEEAVIFENSYSRPGPSSLTKNESAPLGQCPTWVLISVVPEALISTQGLLLGSKTTGRPRKQIPECTQTSGFHTTVISWFE
jgi:hypothetical protein